MIDESTKRKIDGMTYAEMLRLNRFAPSGHPIFTGEVGDYFLRVMREKRDALPPGEAAATSKEIGW